MAPTPACASTMPTAAKWRACGNATRCVARLLMDETDRDVRAHRHAGRHAGLQRRRQGRGDRRHGRSRGSTGSDIPLAQRRRHQPLPARRRRQARSTQRRLDGQSALRAVRARCRDGAGRRARAADRDPCRCFPTRTNVEFASVLTTARIAHAGVGARRGHHAGLRHRRLRHRRGGASPRACRAARSN